MSKSAKGYQVKNYPYFPGSLGNWAGNMKQIPTYTLELPSSDNRQSKKFWKLFEKAMTHAIVHKL
jgi:protein MpaA